MQENTPVKAPTPLIERLFKAGAHFGFTKSRRHPTTLPFLFGNKQGTDIIDLEKTGSLLETAKSVLEDAGKTGKTVLFVGTKEEISSVVKRFAQEAEMPYVVNRWIGGILTNFSEIRKRITRLFELTEQGESGELERKYTKKERVIIGRELEKLTFNFNGIRSLTRPPQLLIVVDPRHESIAVKEALTMRIPVIALSSSDTDLRSITYPIVANDALQSSVTIILEELTDALKKGKSEFVPAKREEPSRVER
jgi:small subunit ribosomal protein S2